MKKLNMKILKFNNILELILFVIMLGLFIIPFEINPNMSLIFENIIGKVLMAIVILSFFIVFFFVENTS